MFKSVAVAVLLVVVLASASGAASKGYKLFLPWSTPADSHPDLSNAERWADYWSQNPLVKTYKLYREFNAAGLDFGQFDIVAAPLVLDDDHTHVRGYIAEEYPKLNKVAGKKLKKLEKLGAENVFDNLRDLIA
jgi:hypothetical protein